MHVNLCLDQMFEVLKRSKQDVNISSSVIFSDIDRAFRRW